jgi:hypothetical protein
MAHSSIGLAGGSYNGSDVARVGLTPELLRVESLVTLVETLLALLLLCEVRMSLAVRSSSICVTRDSRRSRSS